MSNPAGGATHGLSHSRHANSVGRCSGDKAPGLRCVSNNVCVVITSERQRCLSGDLFNEALSASRCGTDRPAR